MSKCLCFLCPRRTLVDVPNVQLLLFVMNPSQLPLWHKTGCLTYTFPLVSKNTTSDPLCEGHWWPSTQSQPAPTLAPSHFAPCHLLKLSTEIDVDSFTSEALSTCLDRTWRAWQNFHTCFLKQLGEFWTGWIHQAINRTQPAVGSSSDLLDRC